MNYKHSECISILPDDKQNYDEFPNEDIYNDTVIDKSFSDFKLNKEILKILEFLGYSTPSPIQFKGLQLCLEGKDLIVQSKSGTGKTLLFILLILSKLENDGISLIIAPTRELVVQINQQVLRFTSLLENTVKPLYSVSGKSIKSERKAILEGAKIVTATPGRILYLFKYIQKIGLNTLVLDEVDMLMDEQFSKQMSYLISNIFSDQTQLIATSATLLPHIADKLSNLIPDRKLVNVSTCLPFVRHSKCDQESPVLRGVKFCFVKISQHQFSKFKCLLHVIESLKFKQAIIFCNKSEDALDAFNNLNNLGYYCNYTSSKVNHSNRMRCLKSLQNNTCKIIICSDLLSRGIDSVFVDLVINFDLPYDKQTFLHRSGRASRFGKRGICVCIATHDEWLSLEYYRMSLKLSIYNLSDLAKNDYFSLGSDKTHSLEIPVDSFYTGDNTNGEPNFEGFVELGKAPFITIYNADREIVLTFNTTEIEWVFDDGFKLTFSCEPIRNKENSEVISKVVVSGHFTSSILLVKLLVNKKVFSKTIQTHTPSKIEDGDLRVCNSALGFYSSIPLSNDNTLYHLYYKFMSFHYTKSFSHVIR